MTTIKEVAKEAGVSVGTVSNAINNLPSVSVENRRKVNDAIKKLKYRPNNAARTLKTNISKSIGLIIPDITNPFYPEVARGIEDAAKKYGYTVFLCNEDRNAHKEREYLRVLMEKNVDGIVIVKPYISIEEIREVQERCNIVVVDMGDEVIPECDQVNIDDYGGSMQAMKFLYENGHKRIAFISGLLECKGGMQRQKAYIDFLRSKDIKVDELLIKRGSYDWHSGYRCTLELLRQIDPPTAIFAANDVMAIGALKAVRDRKLAVPADISIVGSDDIDMASFCSPQLTTIIRPKYEIGAASIELLMKRLGANSTADDEKRVITLKTELIVRESVGRAD